MGRVVVFTEPRTIRFASYDDRPLVSKEVNASAEVLTRPRKLFECWIRSLPTQSGSSWITGKISTCRAGAPRDQYKMAAGPPVDRAE
jgi:hypothetical protein